MQGRGKLSARVALEKLLWAMKLAAAFLRKLSLKQLLPRSPGAKAHRYCRRCDQPDVDGEVEELPSRNPRKCSEDHSGRLEGGLKAMT